MGYFGSQNKSSGCMNIFRLGLRRSREKLVLLLLREEMTAGTCLSYALTFFCQFHWHIGLYCHNVNFQQAFLLPSLRMMPRVCRLLLLMDWEVKAGTISTAMLFGELQSQPIAAMSVYNVIFGLDSHYYYFKQRVSSCKCVPCNLVYL